MKYSKEDSYIVVKLDRGDDIMASLSDLVKKESVSNGYIVSGLGAATNVQIGALVNKTYVNHTFEERQEILSFNGTITEGDPSMHIHIVLAGENKNAVGGHLFKGTADPLMEVIILRFKKLRMTRKLEEYSGLKELSFL